jgi:hypothetical protein
VADAVDGMAVVHGDYFTVVLRWLGTMNLRQGARLELSMGEAEEWREFGWWWSS